VSNRLSFPAKEKAARTLFGVVVVTLLQTAGAMRISHDKIILSNVMCMHEKIPLFNKKE
jgi:hypothetical protein